MNFTVNHVLTYQMKKRFSFVYRISSKKKKSHRNTLSLSLSPVLVCFLLPNEERSINFISGMSAVSGRFVRGWARSRLPPAAAGSAERAPCGGGLPAAAALPPPDRGTRELPPLFGRVSAAAAPWCVFAWGGVVVGEGRELLRADFASTEKRDPGRGSVAVLLRLLLARAAGHLLPLRPPGGFLSAGGERRGTHVCASVGFFALEDLPRNPSSSEIFTEVKPVGELLIRVY